MAVLSTNSCGNVREGLWILDSNIVHSSSSIVDIYEGESRSHVLNRKGGIEARESHSNLSEAGRNSYRGKTFARINT